MLQTLESCYNDIWAATVSTHGHFGNIPMETLRNVISISPSIESTNKDQRHSPTGVVEKVFSARDRRSRLSISATIPKQGRVNTTSWNLPRRFYF